MTTERCSNCRREGKTGKDLLHCSHNLPPGKTRLRLCDDCREAVHLAGVIAGDPETIAFVDRQRMATTPTGHAKPR